MTIRHRRLSGLAFCMLTFSTAALSANVNELSDSIAPSERGFWDHGIGRVLVNADNMLRSWEEAGIDTNYIAVPKHDRMLYLGAYGFYQQHDMVLPSLSNGRQIYTDMHTMQAEMELGIDWRGLSLELPIPIANRYTESYGLAKNGNVWGARIRYKSANHMKGTIEETVPTLPYHDAENSTLTQKDIQRGQLDLRVFYVEGYYVFNSSKFCLAAGLYGDMIQKKSAGGVFVMANYYQSRLGCNNLLNYNRDTFRNNKISLGAGYGYNLALMQGKLCIHASIIPMFSMLNRVTHKFSGQEQVNDEHYYDSVTFGRNSGFTLNAFGRFAVSYSLNERILLNMFTNYRQYLFNASTGLRISNRDADFQFNLGYRF